ncbi:MAG: carboxyl transferase, partial [Eubacterium sp.]|nr:carboxyl transferase [Eubacterium sp.]
DEKVPADGVITGYGVIGDRLVYVYSQDVSAMGGAIGEMNAAKIARLYDMAIKAGAPVIGLLDCAGVRIKEAVDALEGFGKIYKSKIAANGVIPQISAVLGACGGGVAISSMLGDFTFISNEGSLFVNSPNAIENNNVQKCDTSAPKYQAECGNVDFLCETEEEVFAGIRDLIDILPQNCNDFAGKVTEDDMNRMLAGSDAITSDPATALAEISDDNNFIEIKKEHAKDMIIGLMTVNGITIGAIANGPEKVLSAAGCKKAENFIYFCDSFDIPIVTFTNVCGYASSMDEEAMIAKSVADMTAAFSLAGVPRINIITGEAYGSAYVAMNSGHIGADLVLALEGAKIGVMDSKNMARIIYEDEISNSKDSKASLEDKQKEIDEMYDNAGIAAKRGYVDNIIPFAQVRKQLIYALMMFGMR